MLQQVHEIGQKNLNKLKYETDKSLSEINRTMAELQAKEQQDNDQLAEA